MEGTVAILKRVSSQIQSTPVVQLPCRVPHLSNQIWNCKDLFSSAPETLNKTAGATVSVSRISTQISSLLQDGSPEGRWSGIVLLKPLIEARTPINNAWVRNVLSILKKQSDPATTRALATLALCRIFTLTWSHPELIREITTPSLPVFIETCVSNTQKRSSSALELNSTLEAFIVLLPKHSATFRPFESRIRDDILNKILFPPAAGEYSTSKTVSLATKLLVLLYHTAPKKDAGTATKWSQSLKGTIKSAHEVCDALFNPQGIPIIGKLSSLPPWDGAAAGANRLITLLQIVQTYLLTPTGSDGFSLPVGAIVRLLNRIVLLHPSGEIELDMSRIHAQVVVVMTTLLPICGVAVPITLFEDVLLLPMQDGTLHNAVYDFLAEFLRTWGPGLDKSQVRELKKLIECCCDDLREGGTDHPYAIRDNTRSDGPKNRAASRFLSTFLAKVNPDYIPRSVYALCMKTTIVRGVKDGLVAGVLNCGKIATPPLTILTRKFPDAPEVEALVRPRLPTVWAGASEGLQNDQEESESDAEASQDDVKMNGQEEIDEEAKAGGQVGVEADQGGMSILSPSPVNGKRPADSTPEIDLTIRKVQRVSTPLPSSGDAIGDTPSQDTTAPASAGKPAAPYNEISQATIGEDNTNAHSDDDDNMPPLTIDVESEEESG
ncbi:hypothetical protein K470DRAFT_275212 [Piedraia hortae CBS 480.64]|uniref:Pre-rRNA-processing protein RIX1 n=1 Tax=Piedraia hortae CBS 480.64 TaxID=1314780 RepID=A0A6A7C5Z7_9PEZI|nr:hypothetical protein K470DRAFT_275212 [Piedraia hortae CBS 480.64]